MLLRVKYRALITALIAFFFIAAPAIIGIFFVLAYPSLPYFYTWIIAVAFLVYAFSITVGFYYAKLLSFNAFNFNVPLSIVLASLFVLRDAAWWVMLIVALSLIFSAVPVNMLTARYMRRQKKVRQV